jgi:hypothetical protein
MTVFITTSIAPIVFVIVFFKPFKTTICNDNYNNIAEFSPKYKIRFKKLFTDLNDILKRTKHIPLYFDHNINDIHPNLKITFFKRLPEKMQFYDKKLVFSDKG